jgi:hypothetical protein
LSTPLTISEGTFNGAYSSILYVPKGSKSAYQAATEWSKFTNIVELPSTGIESLINSNFNIFPNPVTDNVTITLEKDVSCIVSIYDLQGNVLATKLIEGNITNISTTNLASGLYQVKIISDKGVAVQQLVVK